MNRHTIRIVNRLLSTVFRWFGFDTGSRRRLKRMGSR